VTAFVVKTNPLESEVGICTDRRMYLRRCYRKKDGKRHGYWALVESYRSSRGPRQRVVAYLGEMDAAGRLGIHQQAAGTVAVAQRGLFRDVEPAVGRS